MKQNRRQFLATTSAVTVVPFIAQADGHGAHTFETSAGPITVHPVSHASFVMETPAGTIYVDPVGAPDSYAGFPAADIIYVTHEHGDHFNAGTLVALASADTKMITNPNVFAQLPDGLHSTAIALANGESADLGAVSCDAIPAYNTSDGRLQFHPQGRDNGYVLTIADFRVYISGDTEDIPEMRALQNIDLAFVCMNLPFTMDAEAAASAVSEFSPSYVYPYHYRGRENGTQDPMEFANMLSEGIEAKMGNWYG